MKEKIHLLTKYKKYKKKVITLFIFIIIFIALLVIKISIIKRNNNHITIETEEDILKIPASEENPQQEENDKTLYYIDIKGAVKNPGVYAIEPDKRVQDAIELAGGLTKNGDTSLINLAKALTDEMVIVIYTKDEVAKNNTNSELNTEINDAYKNKSNNTSANNNTSTIININTATKNELMSLSGIGESKANSIIAYREENGNFNTIEEIMNVSGIGQSIYEKIKKHITV